MKKYIFLIIFFLIALFSINNVYAVSTNGWGFARSYPNNAAVNDCGNGVCTTTLNPNADYVDDSHYFYYQGSYTSMSANGPGILWWYSLDNPLKSGYLYSISTYICHQSSANLVFKGNYSSNSANNLINLNGSGTTYFNTALTNLDSMPFTTSSTFTKCGVITTIYSPSVNSQYYGVNYTLSASSNNYTSALIGYDIQSLGIASQLSSSDIQSIINSSGLASASDINSLNSSVNNIQSSLASAQTSINNNIDSAESNIIDSQEQTRDAIIENQNENTDKEIESQKVCTITHYDKDKIYYDNAYLISGSGGLNTSGASNYGVTNYIDISHATRVAVTNSRALSACWYDSSKNYISCFQTSSVGPVTIPTNAKFLRFTIYKPDGNPQMDVEICKNGNQAIADGQQDINNTLNNSDSSGATNEAGGFFSNFSSDTHGLTGIITAPLSAIQGLINNTCSPLVLPLPFVNRNLTLPCLSSIYSNYFGTFFTMYQTITLGIVSYWVLVRIFALVKDFKNPEHDEIEVVEL